MFLVNNIYFKRNNRYILKDVSLSIFPKKIIHLTGNNGAGKTTLLRILFNILEPEKGSIFWNGKNIKKNPYEFYKNSTFIMDSQTSSTNLTVYENIFFWQKLFSSNINISEINSLLSLLSLNQYKNSMVGELSYGERKKLELLRLMIERKKLWILDEPYIGLDQKTMELINYTIINHVELNGMVIFTSHALQKLRNVETLDLNNYV